MTITENPTSTPVIRHINACEGPKAILPILSEDGCVIIRDVIPPELIQRLNQEVDPKLEKGGGPQRGDDMIKEGHGMKTKYLNSLTIHSKSFRNEILNQPLIHGICEGMFREESGDYWLSTASIIETGPGEIAQGVHRDSETAFPILKRMGVNAPETMLAFLVALNEFKDENGATRAIPGSHKRPDFTVPGQLDQTVPAEMQPGDMFVFTGKLLHAGGCNLTRDSFRRGLLMIFQAAYLTPIEAPHSIPREIVESMTPLAQKMIAWRSVDPLTPFGLWKVGFNELGAEMGLRSNQPLK
jgi:hypothetical protein